MKILLIHPPKNKVALAPSNFEPLALEILAATVPTHKVHILDMRFETSDTLKKTISGFRPSLVGITVNNSLDVSTAFKLLKKIHKTDPSIHIAIGGHHPTSIPSDFYTPEVDTIFTGWADKSFPAYVNAMETGMTPDEIPGLIILENGLPVSIQKNQYDLLPDEIPFPNRELTKKYRKRYRNEIGFRSALVNTTRGCPFRCKFCSVWTAVEGHYVVRKAEHVFQEIQNLPKNQKRVFFADDNTFIDTENALKLCFLIKQSGIKIKYSGYCRTDTIVKHPDMLRQWKAIGLDNLCVGFEATDEEGLQMINKSNHTKNNEKAAEILHEIGLPFRSYFLVNADFKENDFKKISDYINRLNLINPMFVVMTPLPGTELFNKEKSRINKSYDYFDFGHWVLPTKLNEQTFYQNYVGLYDSAYSFKRHLNLLYRNMINNFAPVGKNNDHLQFIPLIRLLLLNMIKSKLKRNLYRHYFSKDPQKPTRNIKTAT